MTEGMFLVLTTSREPKPNGVLRVDLKRFFSTGTSSAAAVDAFHNFAVFELPFRHSTDAVGPEVSVSGLDASKTAQVLIPNR